MRFLQQISEPNEITNYKNECRKVPLTPTYSDMPKKTLRAALVKNQGGLCAYCMSRIHNDETRTSDNGYIHIEHIIPENSPIIKKDYDSNLDVENMLGVCAGNRTDNDNKNKHCDASRGGQDITVCPYNSIQMRTIKYLTDGTIYSSDPSVDHDLNNVLNLNSTNNPLKQNRQTTYRKLRDIVQKMCGNNTIKQSRLEKLKTEFCEMDTDGLYREYVCVYEYWLNKWARKA